MVSEFKGRIIAGEFKGKPIKLPKNNAIRPTTDYIKESVFNILEHNFNVEFRNTNAIDICAGSGAFGLEALSRGSEKCVFIDCDKESVRCINDNVKSMGLEMRSRVLLRNAMFIDDKILQSFDRNHDKLLLIFTDPPYAEKKLLYTIIDIVRNMKVKMILIIESSDSFEIQAHAGEKVICRQYGREKKVTLIGISESKQ